MIRALTALSISLVSLAFSGAVAMEIGPGQDGVCLATLSGEIGSGDLATIRALDLAPPATWDGPEDGRWKRLCLNSPGGDFRESLAIARHLVTERIGTVIAEDATCSGTCALVFMFGTVAQGQASGLTSRQLHVGGTLAFQRPQPAVPAGDAPDGGADGLVQTMLGFHALASRMRPDVSRPFLDADLIEALRSLGDAESLAIDTVNKAGRWGIGVIGFKAPALSDRAFFHACQNLTIWPRQLAGDQVVFARNDAVFALSVSNWTAGGAVRDRYDLQFASRDVFDCSATLAAQGGAEALPLICGSRGEADIGIGPADCGDPDLLYLWAPIPALAMVPAATPLAALADGSALPEEDPALTRPTPCQSDDGEAEVINVNNYTSLRRDPHVESAKIDELPKGATFPVPRDPEPDTRHADHAQCAALCAAANAHQPYDRAALGACIDENWMWFRITGPKGAEGYASAKYLDF
ncbi:MAG: hypothetical protein EP318_12855 [Rhodobacteraceae bacterium]|nr:MAG: hypothetical protein EP318_12855 [Paracoccaceae bacterium]